MENKCKGSNSWILVKGSLFLFLLVIFYALHIYFYYDTLLNSDGAYVFMQMREVFTFNRIDFLHIGYQYCGVFEHFFSALLSFIMPTNFAFISGIFLFYWLGYLSLKENFKERNFYLKVILFFPMPVAFYQSYAALGGHTFTLFHFFLGFFFLTHPRFILKNGKYHFLSYFFLGLLSGVSLVSYNLSLLLLIAQVMTLMANDFGSDLHLTLNKTFSRMKMIKEFSRNFFCLTLFYGGYKLGFLPAIYSIHKFPKAHPEGGLTEMNYSIHHLLLKLQTLLNVLKSFFSPFFHHNIITSGTFNHYNYPLYEVVINSNFVGFLLGLAILMTFFFLLFFYFQRILKNQLQVLSQESNLNFLREDLPLTHFKFIMYSLFSLIIFILGYVFRKEFISNEFETRYMLTFYFSLLLLILYLTRLTLIKKIIPFFLILSLLSHLVILNENFNLKRSNKEESSCLHLSRSDLYNILSKTKIDRIVGDYWEIWPLAAALKNSLVLDIYKNKFYFKNEQFWNNFSTSSWLFMTNKDPVSNLAFQTLPSNIIDGNQSGLVSFELGDFKFFTSKNNHLFFDLLRKELRNQGVERCLVF